MTDWRAALRDEWHKRRSRAEEKRARYPLADQDFDDDEIIAMVDVILSGQLTMGERVREFEKEFAQYVGSPFAVMVNSGSSANLLVLAAVTNPLRGRRLYPGDEILVPAVCWSTSIWPILQMGLRPVLIDVDAGTLNLDVKSMKEKTTPRTKGLMVVHVLGNCAPMDEVFEFASEREWIVIEDTCESLGVRWRGRTLGTLGHFGTYSFYFSHHMTTGEGGMIVCQQPEDCDLLKSLRSHGWTRELRRRAEVERRYVDVDPRFLFTNMGYNLRPMEIQGALGIRQLRKLPEMNRGRVANWRALVNAIRAHPKWADQFEFPHAVPGAEPVWFGFPLILSNTVAPSLRAYLADLTERGVENRPIVSGNFARQPALGLFGSTQRGEMLPNADRIHHRGFFIGLPPRPLPPARFRDLADRLLDF